MTDDDRPRAAELAAEARALHAEKNYYAARDRYEESLRLHDEEDVRADYQRLMATIGPV